MVALKRLLLQRTGIITAIQQQQQQQQQQTQGASLLGNNNTTNLSASDLTTSCRHSNHNNLSSSTTTSTSSISSSLMLFRYAIFGALLLVGLWKCLAEHQQQQQRINGSNNGYRAFFSLGRRTKTTMMSTEKAATTTTTTAMTGGAVTGEDADSGNDDDNNNHHHVYTAAHLIPRYTGPATAAMTAAQRTIRDAILASRPRTGLAGPFGPWLAVPAIAEPAQQLGRAVRYGTSLSMAESELVILLTAASTRSAAEFDIHVNEALTAGLTPAVIAAIPRDDAFSRQAVEQTLLPQLLSMMMQDDDQNNNSSTKKSAAARMLAIARFAAELLDTCTVSDETYRTTKTILNDEDAALVEITSIVGYYTYVAYTLNVFRIPSQSTQSP